MAHISNVPHINIANLTSQMSAPQAHATVQGHSAGQAHPAAGHGRGGPVAVRAGPVAGRGAPTGVGRAGKKSGPVQSPNYKSINPTSPPGQTGPTSNVQRGSIQKNVFDWDGVTVQWPEKDLNDSPEVAMVRKIPPNTGSGRYTATICSKLFAFFQLVCKNRVNDGGGLSSFKPIEGRTSHTMEYVNELALKYSPAHSLKTSPSDPNRRQTLSATSSGGHVQDVHSINSFQAAANRSKKKKEDCLSDFYDRAYHSLKKLQRAILGFKHIIFTLTYTRYAEDILTDSEQKMTRGRSIIGSYMWVIVHALQQLQEDPEIDLMQSSTKMNSLLHELSVELMFLLNLSFQTWDEVVYCFGALEFVHKKTEDVFHKQTLNFQTLSAPDSETVNKATLHLKRYRRDETDLDDLKNINFDPYAQLIHFKKGEIGSSRILYKFNYADSSELWNGFDPLPASKKISTLRDILTYVRLILESVKDSAQGIAKALLKSPHAEFEHSGTSSPHLPQGHTQAHRLQNSQQRSSLIEAHTSYEECLQAMDEILDKKLLNIEWQPNEVAELFECDKIFLDDMDVLTLGAGITRTLLNETRHQIHLCYESCRLLDFKEFNNLPTYEKIYRKIKEEFREHDGTKQTQLYLQYPHQNKRFTKGAPVSNAYDIEEAHLELRNVAGLFRTSLYHDILVALPIYTNVFAITLQEVETVFSPSSEKLLATYKDPVHE